MKNCSILLIFFFKNFAPIPIHGKRLFSPGETQYVLRITDVKICPSKDAKPFISDIKWARNGYTQYLSMHLIIEETFTIGRVMARFERCQDLFIGCENFQTWNFTQFCHLLNMKNQLWTEIVDSFSPKTFAQHCPRFNHGIYELRNASVDINKLMSFYKEGIKYHWKVHCFVYNRKNELLYCAEIHAHATSFTKRERVSTPKDSSS